MWQIRRRHDAAATMYRLRPFFDGKLTVRPKLYNCSPQQPMAFIMDALWMTSTLIYGYENDHLLFFSAVMQGAAPLQRRPPSRRQPTYAHFVTPGDKVRVRGCAVRVTDHKQRHIRILIDQEPHVMW